MGFYQMKKYNLHERTFKQQVDRDIKNLLSYDNESKLSQVLSEVSAVEIMDKKPPKEFVFTEREFLSKNEEDTNKPEDFKE